MDGALASWQPELAAPATQEPDLSDPPLSAAALRDRWYAAMKATLPPVLAGGCQCQGPDGKTAMEPKGGLGEVKLDWSKCIPFMEGMVAVRAGQRCRCAVCGTELDFFIWERHTQGQFEREADWR